MDGKFIDREIAWERDVRLIISDRQKSLLAVFNRENRERQIFFLSRFFFINLLQK